jgi:hypothetical protein
MTSGNYNVIIGSNSGSTITGTNNNIILADGQGLIAAQWQNGGGWYQKSNAATWSITSDSRIKENIVNIENGLSIIVALRPVEFDYKINDKKHDIGFIAQEYKNVLPNQVFETTSGGEEIKALTNGEPLLNIQQNLVPYLVKAIQELNAKITALENK